MRRAGPLAPPLWAVLAVLLLRSPAAAQSVPSYWERDAFDWMTPGPLAGRNGWSLTNGTSPQLVALSPQGMSLAIAPAPGASTGLLKAVGVPGTGVQQLRFRVRSDPGSTLAQLVLESSSGVAVLRFSLGSSLGASSAAAGTNVLVGATQQDRWYAVRANLDFGARAASVFVDGRLAAWGLPLGAGTPSRLRLTGSGGTGAVHLADIFGFAPEALPALATPNHAIDFGYYFADSRWGDHRGDPAAYSSLYLADPVGYPAGSLLAWRLPLQQSLWDAARAGQTILLALDQERCDSNACPYSLDEILDAAQPYWPFVDRLLLADEPGWGRAQTEARIQDLETRLLARGLALPPVGIVFSRDEALTSDALQAQGLAWVGIEAYLDPPGSGVEGLDAAALTNYLYTARLRVPYDKQVFFVLQAYDRNGAWPNESTLAALQLPVYDRSYGDGGVAGILAFAFGRVGGTHAYPSLQTRHEAIAGALARWNRPPLVSLTSPADGARVGLGALTLSASASDTDGRVTRVDYYAGTEWVGTSGASPFAVAWQPPGPGVYSIFARAFDDKGARAASAPATVTVGTPASLALGISDASVALANGGGGTLRFTVSLSAPNAFPVSVLYATADGTARAGMDYAAVSGRLVFAPGTTSQPVPVDVLPAEAPAAASFELRLSAAAGATLARSAGTGSIFRAPAVPDASFSACPSVVAPGASLSASVVDGGYLDWVGLYPAQQSAHSPWLSYRYVPLPRPAEVGFVSPSTPGAYVLRLFASDSFRLVDSCPFTVRSDGLTIDDVAANEGDAANKPFQFTVKLAPASADSVSVDYQTADGTATAGQDYAGASGTLSFAPGETTKTITVSVNGDTLGEDHETFFVNLSNPRGAPLARSQGVGTILNDDPLPPIVCPASVPPGAVVTATVGGGNSASDWVGLYRAGVAGLLAWKSVAVPPPRPAVVSLTAPQALGPHELRLFANDSFTLIGSCTFAVAAGPVLAIDDVAVAEANSGSATATFTVTLSPASSGTVSVSYQTSNGTAASGSDYEAASGTLTFPPGETSRTVGVAVSGDTSPEPDETFFVKLSSPAGASIQDAEGLGTILNDDAPAGPLACPSTVSPGASLTATVSGGGSATDWVGLYPAGQAANSPWLAYRYVPWPRPTQVSLTAPAAAGAYQLRLFSNDGFALLGSCSFPVAPGPALWIDDATLTEGDSGTASASFTVTLAPAFSGTVTVDYQTADGTATPGSDYQAAFGTLTFLPGETTKTLSVLVNGDTMPEPTETFFVNLSNAAGASIQDAQGLGTITSDDAAPGPLACPAAVSPGASLAATVNGGGSSLDWVGIYPAGQAASSPWLAYRYVPLPRPAAVSFTAPSAAGAYELRLFANNGFARLGSCPFSVSAGPAFSIADAAAQEANAGTASLVFTVTLSAAASETASVAYATADATATAGSDYVATSGTLVFAPGETSKTLAVAVNGDTACERDETFFVNLSGATGASILDGQALGRILNDETNCGPITVSPPAVPRGGTVIVSVSDGPGNARDWVGLYPVGGGSLLSWQYLNGSHVAPGAGRANATLSFAMPNAPGSYLFKLFVDDTFQVFATSGTVTVP